MRALHRIFLNTRTILVVLSLGKLVSIRTNGRADGIVVIFYTICLVSLVAIARQALLSLCFFTHRVSKT